MHDEGLRIRICRERDDVIMEIALRRGWDKDQLRRLNAARIYMKACTVSDLASEDGTMIMKTAWELEGPTRESEWE